MWLRIKRWVKRLISADYTDYADFGVVVYSRVGWLVDGVALVEGRGVFSCRRISFVSVEFSPYYNTLS
jgi:hypothetical protein